MDIRDLLISVSEIRDAQLDEFLTKNPGFLGYADLTKLTDFRTAISQMGFVATNINSTEQIGDVSIKMTASRFWI